MESILKVSAALVHSLYMLLAINYGILFFTTNRIAQRLAKPLLFTTLTLHLGYLTLLTVRWHQFPAATSSQGLSLVAFAVTLVYAFVEWRGRETSTGFWVLSLACLFEILSSLFRSDETPYREIFHSPFFAVHAATGLLAYAAFVVAAGYGFLFLRLYSEIKRRKFSLFFGKLPPLEVLERLMAVAVRVGFIALAGSIALGMIWAEQLFGNDWMSDPKTTFTLATWLFYGAALLLHQLRRWQGRQMAVASLAGFAAILFSLVATNLFFTDLHDF